MNCAACEVALYRLRRAGAKADVDVAIDFKSKRGKSHFVLRWQRWRTLCGRQVHANYRDGITLAP